METLIIVGVVLLVISIVLYALGARGTAGLTASVGKFILIAGIVIFLILLVIGLLSG